MATLSASAKLANIKRSLDVYLTEHALLSSFAFDVGPPVPFSDAGLAEWLQPRLLEPVRTAALMQVSSTKRGEDWELRVNVNVFVRLGSQTLGHRLHQIRDLVAAVFTENQRIEVRDYEGAPPGGTFVGHLVVDRIEADRRVIDPARVELEQWNLIAVMRHVADWTP